MPTEGRMAWVRAWYGIPARRGAACRVNGRNALVLSASGGYLHVRIWNTGERVSIRPTAAVFA